MLFFVIKIHIIARTLQPYNIYIMDFDPSKDYYKSLWIDSKASADEIKKAFRKLAMQHHPDKKWGDKVKFQEINEANGVVWDERKRQQYDSYRTWWWGMGGFGWGQGGFWGFGWWQGWFEVDLWDVMDQFFGGGRWNQASGPQPGEDIQVSLEITFEESYNGVSKTIEFSRKVKVQGATEETCPTCKGKWRVIQQSQTIFGVMQTQNICPTCQWSGKLYTKNGKRIPGGLEIAKEELTVNIPAAINDSVYIRHTGKGDTGSAGGSAGDLYVQIRVKPSSIYSRKAEDLYINASVSLFDLVLWHEINIPHPTGEKTIKIPKGTQISDKVKVWGLGFGTKWIFSGHGDLYVIPKLHIPKKLSKEEEKLRSELDKLNK